MSGDGPGFETGDISECEKSKIRLLSGIFCLERRSSSNLIVDVLGVLPRASHSILSNLVIKFSFKGY